jgi:hypothetical protein
VGSTTIARCAFSTMKIIKISLHNNMEDIFLKDYMLIYIEDEIAKKSYHIHDDC